VIVIGRKRAAQRPQLRHAFGATQSADDLELRVVALALHESTLRFWLSDADDAIPKGP
jgi:hypothetical protein